MSFEAPPLGSDQRHERDDEGIEAFVLEQFNAAPSAERQEALNAELATVSTFFEQARILAFVAGGTGVDLLDGHWDRDHQDLDVAMMGSQRRTLYEEAVRAGFSLISADGGQPLDAHAIVDPAIENAFAARTDAAGTTRFEVIFMDDRVNGDVMLSPRVAASQEVFAQAPRVQVADREVMLQPPEVILFYKLMDGRRKDLRDIAHVWDTLSPAQQERLNAFVREEGVHFVVDGEALSDVPSLLSAAAQKEAALRRAFFDEGVKALDAEESRELRERCEAFFALRQRTEDRDTFLQVVEQRYPDAPRTLVDAATEMLYQAPTPSLEAFVAWARSFTRVDERLKKRARDAYASEQIWTVGRD